MTNLMGFTFFLATICSTILLIVHYKSKSWSRILCCSIERELTFEIKTFGTRMEMKMVRIAN